MTRLPAVFFWAAGVPLCFGAYWFYHFERDDHTLGLAERKRLPYAASEKCMVCHADHYRTWHATYHRTMTARAVSQNVKAPAPATLNFYGYTVAFQKREDAYFVELPFLNGEYRRFPVLYTIGSRRMQQFAVRDGDKIYRIPVVYNIETGKWTHANELFFRKRKEGLNAFTQGYSLWNANCIFCHNTRPNPGLNPRDGVTFNSTVEELGIACEECHGPGNFHVRAHANPLRRYFYEYARQADPSIVHPARLDSMRGTQICGQCHGQRLPRPPERIAEMMTKGDPYISGANLFDYYKPLDIRDELPDYKEFHARFWKDGSPRLTAYEFQGLAESACFKQSKSMTCMTCHTMHGGDPKGMMKPKMRTNAACTQCHVEYQERAAAEKHSKHSYESADCYSCHMPEVVYGILTLHPTHLIRNPDPTRTVKHGMPDACNICHLDKGVNWAIDRFNVLWNKNLPKGDSSFDVPEILRGFARGDVVYRAILLDHARRKELKGFEDVYRRGLDDEFPVVSRFAKLALARRYGAEHETEEEWKRILATKAFRLFPELDALHINVDEEFDFGE